MKDEQTILLLEDDEVDVASTKRTMKELNIKNPLVVCENGAKGLEWLRANAQTLPGLILLDINMPVMSGLDFLDEIKHDTHLKKIPMIILTTSMEESDRMKAAELGIAGYIIKPINSAKYLAVMKTLATYWQKNESSF